VAGEDLNAIDPGVMRGPDGRVWLCYGSYHGTIQLVELDPKTGLRIAPNSPVAIIGRNSEASEMIYHGGYYYLFVNHGTCCQGYRSTYHIVVGRSAKVTGPYLDRQGYDMVNGGGTLFLKTGEGNIGPGHFGYLIDDGIEKFSCHYEAVVGGTSGSVLDIRPLLWSADGWPLPGANLKDGIYTVRSMAAGAFLEVSPGAAGIGRANQKFYIAPAGGGFYKITTTQSGIALTAMNDSVRPAPFTGLDGQLWKIDELTDGTYRIQSKAGHQVLTATVLLSPGDGIALQPFTGSSAQRWAVSGASWLAVKFHWFPYLP
jgi:arabinan endo-1,5-alpha-L-arabinosidase